jgi:hypothetical protein
MTTPATPFDPRQPQYSFGDSTMGFDGAPAQRPGGLTAICVIAIVLGALGLCGSLLTLGILAMQKPLENAFKMQQKVPSGIPESFKAQMEMQNETQNKMQEATQKVNQRYWGVHVGLGLLNLAFAGSLLAGGIMALKLNPKARAFLVVVFAAAIVFEIVRTIVIVFVQLNTVAVLSAIPNSGAGPAVTMMTFAKVAAIGGMVFWAGFGLAKIVFYGIGAAYLRRPNIRALFQETTIDQM